MISDSIRNELSLAVYYGHPYLKGTHRKDSTENPHETNSIAPPRVRRPARTWRQREDRGCASTGRATGVCACADRAADTTCRSAFRGASGADKRAGGHAV